MTFPPFSSSQDEPLPERTLCPLCSSIAVTPFLFRENVPVLTNLLLEHKDAACQIRRGTIHLTVCEQCGFVFNRAFDSAALYDGRYDNSQAYAPSFVDYLDERIRQVLLAKPLPGGCVVEVGCGNGFFLRRLIEADVGTTGYGFDPSYGGPFSMLDGRLHFQPCYYDERCSEIPADILVCRHVIEHIPQPLPFLAMIRQTLAHSPHTRAFFETPTVEWILQNQVIWDIYYEHCSYFAPNTITLALELAGFRVERIEHTFGGQYLWIEATVCQSDQQPANPVIQSGSLPALAAQFERAEHLYTTHWQSIIQTLRQEGPVALLGAAGKGVTLANLIDPTGELISCVVDVNPQKQHKYLPGTGHPIVPYEELQTHGIASALLLNPNYYEDARKLLEAHHLSVRLVTEQANVFPVVGIGKAQRDHSLDFLAARMEQERLAGRTVVFTNGVFDLLHAGHVQFLRYAKTLGDILVVAVDSDISTRQLKGPGRPINNERDRLMLIAALGMVDYAILFESDMLALCIRMFRPHIHIKGGDYRGKVSPVADALQEVGGRSVIAPLFSNDLHTSQIIERIAALVTRQ